tara:strand:+ start:379 stop:660 length:282 start_codon:yes stop_codon:yes gene_type:complete
MAVLTTISGIPLYTTIQEALDWAASVGLTGYHTHQYQGITGYMGGSDHNNAITGNINATIPTQQTQQTAPPPPPTTMGSGGGSGGSGGSGGGY